MLLMILHDKLQTCLVGQLLVLGLVMHQTHLFPSLYFFRSMNFVTVNPQITVSVVSINHNRAILPSLIKTSTRMLQGIIFGTPFKGVGHFRAHKSQEGTLQGVGTRHPRDLKVSNIIECKQTFYQEKNICWLDKISKYVRARETRALHMKVPPIT